MSLGGTRWAAVVALAGTVVATTGYAAHAQWDSTPIGGVVTDTNYHCGSHDKPEGVIQGDVPRADITSGRARQGYNCGLALVGHTKLDNDRVPTGNANMAWAGACAYVTGPSSAVAPDAPSTPPANGGVAVVDV